MIYNLAFSSHGREDLRVPVTAVKVAGLKQPDWTLVKTNGAGSTGVYTYAFDKTLVNEVWFNCQMPHSWETGTTIYPHVHWTAPTNGAAGTTVRWGLEYTFKARGSVFGNTTIIYGSAQVPSGNIVAFTHYVTSIGTGIDMSSISTTSAMMLCRLFRDAPVDNYNYDAYLLEFDFHHAKNRLGDAVTTW